MFTGIIEALGQVSQREEIGGDVRLTLLADSDYLADCKLGDSIAVNGVCLAAVGFVPRGFVADLSAGPLPGTTPNGWGGGSRVNFEKALTPAKPLGGHLVSGHVDGVGHLLAQTEEARGWRLRFAAPAALARYIAQKGSITINGISLTVNEVQGAEFGVMIVPHTRSHTTLGGLQVGDAVNLEVDLIARYLERLLSAREQGLA